MSSTSIEFGLINTFRTGNIVIDTLFCMLIPLVIQQVMTYIQGSGTSIFMTLYNFLFLSNNKHSVVRSIETTQRFNQYGKVWDGEQTNHLLQKAISLYLADVLDLKNKNAKYELLDKPKKKNKQQPQDKHLDDISDSESMTSCSSFDSKDDSDDSTYYGEVDKLSVEALPPLNRWVTVEEGVQFKQETVTSDNNGNGKAGLEQQKLIFRFYSWLPDGSDRIDALIQRAFKQYQDAERERYSQDKSRYFYIQSGTKKAQGNADSGVVYKRYKLGEEKTFDNLFFDGKEQVLKLLDNFTNRAGKFAIKGFPYKLGLLLHGPPGTGKTSLIKAVAQYTKRHIVTISLAKIKTNQELMDALFDLKVSIEGEDLPIDMTFEDVVFVMEDIDCASSIVNARANDKPSDPSTTASKEATTDDKLLSAMMKACTEDEKKSAQRNDKLNLSGLLNVLDGVIDCPGRIVIMTTNHPEKLDPALIRPGRVNKKLMLGYMGVTHIQEMIEYYCTVKLTLAQSEHLQNAFNQSVKRFTPAEVEEICAEHDDVEDVLRGFAQLAESEPTVM